MSDCNVVDLNGEIYVLKSSHPASLEAN